jgi:hypothetical protein
MAKFKLTTVKNMALRVQNLLLFLGFNLATKRPHSRIGSHSNMR